MKVVNIWTVCIIIVNVITVLSHLVHNFDVEETNRNSNTFHQLCV